MRRALAFLALSALNLLLGIVAATAGVRAASTLHELANPKPAAAMTSSAPTQDSMASLAEIVLAVASSRPLGECNTVTHLGEGSSGRLLRDASLYPRCQPAGCFLVIPARLVAGGLDRALDQCL